MEVKVKTIDWKPLFYETGGACWFDFKASSDYKIPPQTFILIETQVVVEVPEWYVLQIMPRSSTFKNYWLIQTNGVGIIDSDYSWNTDTIKFPYFNISNKTAIIKAGDRIGQWVFVKIERANFKVVDDMWSINRWWFGTTWK